MEKKKTTEAPFSYAPRYPKLSFYQALFYWILETSIDVLLFHKGNFAASLLTSYVHEIWMRPQRKWEKGRGWGFPSVTVLSKIAISHYTGLRAALRLVQEFGDRFFFASVGMDLEV